MRFGHWLVSTLGFLLSDSEASAWIPSYKPEPCWRYRFYLPSRYMRPHMVMSLVILVTRQQIWLAALASTPCAILILWGPLPYPCFCCSRQSSWEVRALFLVGPSPYR